MSTKENRIRFLEMLEDLFLPKDNDDNEIDESQEEN